MKKNILLHLFVFLSLVSINKIQGAESRPLLSWNLFPDALQVVNSSTVRIIANGMKKDVKLYGICSTGVEENDKDAVSLISDTINGKRTEIKIYGKNEFGESLGRIVVDGIDVNRVIADKKYVLSGEKCKSLLVKQKKDLPSQTKNYNEYKKSSIYIPHSNSSYSSHPDSTGRKKTVHVRSYYRKDGTYVKPHSRSAPKR